MECMHGISILLLPYNMIHIVQGYRIVFTTHAYTIKHQSITVKSWRATAVGEISLCNANIRAGVVDSTNLMFENYRSMLWTQQWDCYREECILAKTKCNDNNNNYMAAIQVIVLRALIGIILCNNIILCCSIVSNNIMITLKKHLGDL